MNNGMVVICTTILVGDERKYKHLTYLFEAVYGVAIAPINNITKNPTGEWELRYFGE